MNGARAVPPRNTNTPNSRRMISVRAISVVMCSFDQWDLAMKYHEDPPSPYFTLCDKEVKRGEVEGGNAYITEPDEK